MSLANTKTNFEQLIADKNNAVIALTGKWGSGKSHLWTEVQRNSNDDGVKKSLYISLFGVKDILQLKIKILQSLAPDSKAGRVAREVATVAWKEATKFLKGFHSGFAALHEIALLAVPAILRDRMIVIDDIERKHKNLSIDEVMGFIDEFTQLYRSRIVLILNSDQLDDKKMWDTLREKVIDNELALETTPEEAFDIAVAKVPSTGADVIRRATVACKISNIRIVQKIIRVVERLIGSRPNLGDEIINRVVPSTVLLAAIHYKGLENGLTAEYVLTFSRMSDAVRRIGQRNGREEVTEADRLAMPWKKLLNELGISATNDFEWEVAAFLKSGLIDAAKFDTIFERYENEKERFTAQERYRGFFEAYWWEPGRTEADLLAEAASFMPWAHLLGAYEVTDLGTIVAELPDGARVADGLIETWLTAFRRKEFTEFSNENFFKRDLHPLIRAEFEALKARLNPVPSLFEAYAYIVTNSGWGEPQIAALRAATPGAFEEAIKSLSGEKLKLFMQKNVEMHVERDGYNGRFGDASWEFVAACRAICYEDFNPRLSKIIQMLFDEANIRPLLAVHDYPRPPQPSEV